MRRQYTERQEYERIVAALQEEFSSEELRHLMAHGAAMTEDQAIEAALNM